MHAHTSLQNSQHQERPPTESVLKIEGLSISYKSFKAVTDLSFSVARGEIFGLLGPNGAGKTSTISAIEGLLKPQSGTIYINAYNVAENKLLAKAQLGVQLQASAFQHELNLSEILDLYASLYGIPMNSIKKKELLDDIKLFDHHKKPFGRLSGGQQQRFALTLATLHRPPLVLLDEPTTGLDPQSRRQLWQRLEMMRDDGHSVLLTTHSMEEAESVCDRIAIMDHGHLIEIGAPVEIVQRHRDDPEVIRASRRGSITLEDVFIGLTGAGVRT